MDKLSWNKRIFSLISNTACGYCFYRDAKHRRILRYRYNNVPADNGGRYFYINDGTDTWTPSYMPMKKELDFYECRHGMGHTSITGERNGIELISVAYGMWDFIKNSGECDADNWELEFVRFLPGKRESRRYVGDYIMTQNDVRTEGKFEDIVAYGGWTMDDHNPAGINTRQRPNIFHPAPSPFGIPYRCLYSVNIENLWFAGRNISVTHTAMSATRVMATCALLGQAVGTAASVAVKYNATPREVYKAHISELKQMLMEDDCYLPFNRMEMSEITKTSQLYSTGTNVQKLLNGIERQRGDEDNCWSGRTGDTITFIFDSEKYVREVRFVFNSDLNRETTGADGYINEKMNSCNVHKNSPALNVPKTLVRSLKAELLDESGKWNETDGIEEKHQRLVRLSVNKKANGIRFTPLSTHGNDKVQIYSIDIK